MSSRSNATRADDPVVGVDLDDVEHLGVERLGPLVATRSASRLRARRSPRVAMTVDVMFATPTSATARMFCDLGIPTVSDAGVHHPTAIVDADVVGQHLRHASQSRAAKYAWKRSYYSACRVLQPRRRPTELVESRERGVEVCLVEYLAAVDQVALDRHKVDLPPLGVEALLRSPVRRAG